MELLDDDPQALIFRKFISEACAFASADTNERLALIPVMAINLRELIIKIREETQEFSEIANCLSGIIQAFCKLVMETKSILNKTKNYVKLNLRMTMKDIRKALMPDSGTELISDNIRDFQNGLEKLSDGNIT